MNVKTFPLIIVCLFLFSSVGFSGATDSLKIIEKKNKKFLKNYPDNVFIPAGTTTVAVTEGESIAANLMNSVFSVDNYFMKKGEVTNSDYLAFLNYCRTKDTSTYVKALPDTLVWRTPLAYNEPYVEYYLRHPSYQTYPVVGVSYQQAKLFCEWLTKKYNQNPERVFKKVVYRLPTQYEWVYAAQGGSGRAIYPWNGEYMRASNGDLMANCLRFGTEDVYRDTLYEKDYKGEFKEVYIYRTAPHRCRSAACAIDHTADITAPAVSYRPSPYGLYNMAGNVCEMVEEIGITHGGSWRDPGAYLQNSARQFYKGENSASSKRGFRYVIEVLEY
ncbi:MAG: SUMF1/EgtB/PvdO family nonheme iron enzyme [Crocinitomix sp.]|nr:SUMF1/EgtB/PvdO family nonheme iron enzyme [Crocinitomix sp.]